MRQSDESLSITLLILVVQKPGKIFIYALYLFLAPHSDSPSTMPPLPLDPSWSPSLSPVDVSQSSPLSTVDMSQSPPPSPVNWSLSPVNRSPSPVDRSPSLPLSPVDSSWSPSRSEEEREQNRDNGESSHGGHGSV